MLVTEDLEQVIKAVTDRIGPIMDKYRLGLRAYFRCGASGLFYPEDYLKEWGIKYGIGLGPHVVSESLQTDYNIAPPDITPQIKSINQIMHPVYVSCAQMDFVMMDPSEVDGSTAILARDDSDMSSRAAIVRSKQLKNPKGRLHEMQASFDKSRKGF